MLGSATSPWNAGRWRPPRPPSTSTPSTSQHELDDRALTERIRVIHTDSRGTYGAPRVHQVLRREGVDTSRKRASRLMRAEGLVGRCRRRWTTTTIADPQAATVDLVKRVFGPGTVELDRIYVGDVTYIWTWELAGTWPA